MELKGFSVSQVNGYISRMLDNDLALQNIPIIGEISNYKPHYSGHMYFTLKDDYSKIKCVMFKGSAQYLDFVPKDGDKVIAKGNIRVFERDGQYQVYVNSLQNYGLGELYSRFEQLKLKLEKQGYFDKTRKRPLPYIPRRIGVVTSGTGAAIRDIISVITRRWDNANIVIYPVAVQGEDAALQISKAIDYFSINKNVDVIITGRGGGSIEELWAFNEEIVANSIFRSEVPVVSAVGHETDYTISDFVADVRAATPSAAAELVVPEKIELLERLEVIRKRMFGNISNSIELRKRLLKSMENSYVFRHPHRRIEENTQILDEMFKTLVLHTEDSIFDKKQNMDKYLKLLGNLNPLTLMERGYTIVHDPQNHNKTITSVKDLKIDSVVRLLFKDGETSATIQEIIPGGIVNGQKKD